MICPVTNLMAGVEVVSKPAAGINDARNSLQKCYYHRTCGQRSVCCFWLVLFCRLERGRILYGLIKCNLRETRVLICLTLDPFSLCCWLTSFCLFLLFLGSFFSSMFTLLRHNSYFSFPKIWKSVIIRPDMRVIIPVSYQC